MPTCESFLATRPILYNDTIQREEVHRDDMWAVTTEELNGLEIRLRCLREDQRRAKVLSDLYDNSVQMRGMLEQENQELHVVIAGLKRKIEKLEAGAR